MLLSNINMKIAGLTLLMLVGTLQPVVRGQALYYRNDALEPTELQHDTPEAVRQARQTQTDLTVRTILEWLQGKSVQPGRKARDNTASHSQPARQYLPVPEGPEVSTILTSSRPRPFQPNPTPTASPTPGQTGGYTYQPSPRPTPADLPPIPSTSSGGDVRPHGGSESSGSVSIVHNDELHPPHIHSIDVECAKDFMVISIEFDRAFDGVIYSKGFYKQDACRYVNENSGQKRYTLTVRLDSCGTQFVDKFQEGGQAYLENVLVLQNEPGIQEVWDTVRRVRCLWEGNINKALTVELSVDMLNQEIVTFSGDTAVANLDIQLGRGPFAPKATGLVKIGETMTLVVSVEGDPGFDVQVHDCIARDATSTNVVRLTDERGCVLRPKLMGAFQKTRETGNSPASIIAYAFFQAFKFPDVMDLTLECNVELCKVNCEACPESGQNTNPLVRRRRDLWSDNSTLGDAVRVFRSLRVIAPDDVQDPSAATVINLGIPNEGVCMSLPGFLLTAMLLLAVLIGSSVLCAFLWLKQNQAPLVARTIHLDPRPASKA